MKLATWNVNSLWVRLPQVLEWLDSQAVDLLALQELKLTDDKFPHQAFAEAGYHSLAFGQKTYNGVALLSRAPLDAEERNLPHFEDPQARVLTATLPSADGPVRIINGYFVNGHEPGSDKFAYKMRWLDALHDWVADQLTKFPRLVLLGDFNVAPEDADSFDPVGLKDTIHHTQEERAQFKRLLQLGLHDSFRLFEQAPKTFSWWDYRMLGFQKNRGLRIDCILVSDVLRPQVTACEVDRAPRKNKQPSDHAPVIVSIAPASGA